MGVLIELDGTHRRLSRADFERERRPDDVYINLNLSVDASQPFAQIAQRAIPAPQPEPKVIRLEIAVDTPKPLREIQEVERDEITGTIKRTITNIEY